MNGQLLINFILIPAQIYLEELIPEDKGNIYLSSNTGEPYIFYFQNFTKKLFYFYFLIPKEYFINYWNILMNTNIWTYLSSSNSRNILKIELELLEEDYFKTTTINFKENYLIKVKGYELL